MTTYIHDDGDLTFKIRYGLQLMEDGSDLGVFTYSVFGFSDQPKHTGKLQYVPGLTETQIVDAVLADYSNL